MSQAGAQHDHPMWSSRLMFILAATGSAVGLGNIWKFPYITGENGGGAFVLVYLACIMIVGIPIMMAEISLGRRGRSSPIRSLQTIIRAEKLSVAWSSIAWMGFLSAFLILSFYSVIGGWALDYTVKAATDSFSGIDAKGMGTLFGDLLANPPMLFIWHTLFMITVVIIVSQGIKSGLEKAVSFLMPILFILLLVMVGYAMSTDGFAQGFSFLFSPDFSKLTTEGVLTALGHAFFTLSLGMAVMMAYGSFLPQTVSLSKTVFTIALLDTLVALLAGLAIFPLVFSNGLEAGAGPGLIFQTLPLAFAQMSGGTLFSTLFFFLLVVAAVTSAISLLEPVVEWFEERRGFTRLTATLLSGTIIWLLGATTVLSFNHWKEIHPLGLLPVFADKTFFDLFDYFTANIFMPLGGLLIALLTGWFIQQEVVKQEMAMTEASFKLFMFVLRYLTPVAVLIVFVYNLF